MTRVVHLANLVHATSGGIRSVLSHVSDALVADGHPVHAVVAGRPDAPPDLGAATVRAVGGVGLPGTGYRLALRRDPVLAALELAAPDVLLLSDRWTLGWAGRWAAARGVPTVLLAHERLDRTVAAALRLPPPVAAGLAAVLDARVTATAAVAPSHHVAGEVARVAPVTVLPWAVDRDVFRPDAGPRPPGRPGRDRAVRLVWCGRLSREKRPGLAVAALEHLLAREVPSTLTVVGDGPLRGRLAARGADLPLHVRGRLGTPREVAAELAAADVLLSTCDHEAFGLAAEEALACGTPVVSVAGGAVADRVAAARDGGPAPGAVAPATGSALASAAHLVAADPWRRTAARRAGHGHDWARVARGLLRAAGVPAAAGGR